MSELLKLDPANILENGCVTFGIRIDPVYRFQDAIR